MNGRTANVLLIVFVVQAVLQLVGRGRDIVHVTRALLLGIPSDTIAVALVLCQIAIAVWAIFDGWRTEREARTRLRRDSFFTDGR